MLVNTSELFHNKVLKLTNDFSVYKCVFKCHESVSFLVHYKCTFDTVKCTSFSEGFSGCYLCDIFKTTASFANGSAVFLAGNNSLPQ